MKDALLMEKKARVAATHPPSMTPRDSRRESRVLAVPAGV